MVAKILFRWMLAKVRGGGQKILRPTDDGSSEHWVWSCFGSNERAEGYPATLLNCGFPSLLIVPTQIVDEQVGAKLTYLRVVRFSEEWLVLVLS
jgi:hypothetical protein